MHRLPGNTPVYLQTMSIKHIVLVRVPESVSPTQVQEAFDDLATLKGQLPGLLSFVGGPNTSIEPAAQGYNYGFVMQFADAAARDAYVPHPLHQQGARRLRALRDPQPGGILVFDLEE